MSDEKKVEKLIQELQSLFPESILSPDSEHPYRRIDLTQLQKLLGKRGAQKRNYHLDWRGKDRSESIHSPPDSLAFKPQPRPIPHNRSSCILIEGDNRRALELLQNEYQNRIKIIYIDPPYNTGNQFIYQDDFSVRCEDGHRYRHSNWLSMMQARIILAHRLLHLDGVIFVSIGTQELANLKLLMDEIFGEENFIDIFSWVKTATPPSLSKKTRQTNEYILCYEKKRNKISYKAEPTEGRDEPLLNRGNGEKTLLFPKNSVYFQPKAFPQGIVKAQRYDRVTLLDDIHITKGYADKDFRLRGEFKWSQAFLDREVAQKTHFIIRSRRFSVRFQRMGRKYKRPTNHIKDRYTSPLIDKKSCGVKTNEEASKHLEALMEKKLFSYPKPVSLIHYLINFVAADGDIVLDFFAGSGTTYEACLRWTEQNRQFLHTILVQEKVDLQQALANTKNKEAKRVIQNGIQFLKEHRRPLLITELTKERIKRVSQRQSSGLPSPYLQFIDIQTVEKETD
ncbi:MAG: site-specific DNA-methyltransferase [Myxococcota bacterium]|nr:site-specific DNA-methyltransferase [Myxococcota bacterium]